MKKIICLALCLALVAGLTPAALAEENRFWTGVGIYLDDLGEDLSDALSEAGDALNEGWQAAKKDIDSFAEEAGEWFAESADALRGYADDFSKWAEENLSGVWEDVKDTASDLWESFLQGMTDVVGKVVSLLFDGGDIQTALDKVEPLVFVYVEEYAHAYAREALQAADELRLATTPEVQTALDALTTYAASASDAEAGLEAIEAQISAVNDWLTAGGLAEDDFSDRVQAVAQDSTLRRFCGAVVKTTQKYAGERDASLTKPVTACLEDLQDYADGLITLEADRMQEISETLEAWLKVNAIEKSELLETLFADMLGENEE